MVLLKANESKTSDVIVTTMGDQVAMSSNCSLSVPRSKLILIKIKKTKPKDADSSGDVNQEIT